MATGESAHSGSTARRMVLGGQLRRLREARDISREDAGHAIRGSESKISRMELGRVSFKERDVADLLTLYGVHEEEERGSFLDLVRQSNQPGWWNRYSDLMPRWFQDYVGLEESASRVQTYEVLFVPGLLQTERYARAVVRRGIPDASEDEVSRRVNLRMQRKKVFTYPRPPRLWAVIDESVLHRPLGGPEVLREQVEELLELVKLPNVSLQVVPFAPRGSSAESAFTMLRFAEPELPDIVYLEHLCGALYLDKPAEIDLYSQVFHRLTLDAATPAQTKKILNEVRNRLG
nr:helix-turn-helix transcriptional regulator [Actinoalloteichus spitiensis]